MAALTLVGAITPSRQITVTYSTDDAIGSGVAALIIDNTAGSFDVEKVIAGYPDQVFMLGFMRRYDASYTYAKQLIDEGRLMPESEQLVARWRRGPGPRYRRAGALLPSPVVQVFRGVGYPHYGHDPRIAPAAGFPPQPPPRRNPLSSLDRGFLLVSYYWEDGASTDGRAVGCAIG